MTQKKNPFWLSIFIFLITQILGIIISDFLTKLFAQMSGKKEEAVFILAFTICAAMFTPFTYLIYQELGYLLFGLISGYKFQSIIIGKWYWKMQDGVILKRRIGFIGGGVQCTLIPPHYNQGIFPYKLYVLGPGLFHIITGLIYWGITILLPNLILPYDVPVFTIAEFLIAFIFLLPFPIKKSYHNGYHVCLIQSNPKVRYAFWAQKKILQETDSHQYKEMPEEWFFLPESEERKCNAILAKHAVRYCERLMNQCRWAEAYAVIHTITEEKNRIQRDDKLMLECNRIFCEIMIGKRKSYIHKFSTQKLLEYMKVTHYAPWVIRTQYAYALLIEKNKKEADKLKEKFNKIAEIYPYTSVIRGEVEMMMCAERELFFE